MDNINKYRISHGMTPLSEDQKMKMALEIEGDICDIILKHIDGLDAQMKTLYSVNRFKSAIYERLELSQEEFNKICDEVIKEREKRK